MVMAMPRLARLALVPRYVHAACGKTLFTRPGLLCRSDVLPSDGRLCLPAALAPPVLFAPFFSLSSLTCSAALMDSSCLLARVSADTLSWPLFVVAYSLALVLSGFGVAWVLAFLGSLLPLYLLSFPTCFGTLF